MIFIINAFGAIGQTCILSDDFSSNQLSENWQHYKPQLYTYSLSNGKLEMTINESACNNNCPWFNTESAGYIYQEIMGDFDFVAVVGSVVASGPNQGQDVTNDTQLAGIMVRDGTSGSENYIFNVVGTRFDIASIETKSTVNGSSGGGILHFPVNSTRSELRIERVGATFNLYSRVIGASSWTFRTTITRNDLPQTLQLGLISYAFLSYPVTLSARFDDVVVVGDIQENSWLGGSGNWGDPTQWSLNLVPHSNHHVIIDNLASQVITIEANQNYFCNQLSLTGNLTELRMLGKLELFSGAGCP